MTDASSQAAKDAEEARKPTLSENDGTSLNPVEILIARMEAHNTEAEAIDAELTRLGLTRKKVNSILSTKARIAKEEAQLALLTGAGS